MTPTDQNSRGSALSKLILLLACLVLAAGGLVAWVYSEDKPSVTLADRTAEVQPLTAMDALSLTAISREDLPPEGTRSLFDHILAENGGLPFPFSEMMKLLRSYDVEGRNPTTLMVPFSRSLLKAESDLSSPRVVVAADMQPPHSANSIAPMFKGRLFLGFTEGADEIEVVSYNEAAGRFEFQLVKDYREGGTPKIVYAKRAVCIACHANESTIFPVRPWQETTASPAVTAAVNAARGTTEPFHGMPVAGSLAIADRIDGMTDVGNSLATTQRIWIDGCGSGETGVRCRQLMLELGLSFAIQPGAFDENDPRVAELTSLQAKSWPTDGIALPNSDLVNRDPLIREIQQPSLKKRIRNSLDKLFNNAEEQGFDDVPPLPAVLDPLTPRQHKAILGADSLEGIYGVAQMFSQSDTQHLEAASQFDNSKLASAIQSDNVAALLNAAPLQRVALMQGLLTALGSQQLSYCCNDVSELSEPIADGEPPLEIAAGSVLEDYREYCFACHRGNPSARLNFMGGKQESEVLERIAATDAIREALDWERYLGTAKENKLMPPKNSYQYRLLEKHKAEGRDPLPEMAKAVPDLFEF